MATASASRDELRGLVAIHEDDLPLDRVMLSIAREEYPDIDVDRYLSALDRLADRASRRASTIRDPLRALPDTLFLDEGFRGNAENYYDPKNSLLNEVLDRRLGAPITLSIIYIEVARRTGSRAVGIGFPGHFLVRHDVAGRSVLLDPFNKGAVVKRADCERLLQNTNGGHLELEPWMLAPSSAKSIVLRVLTNLKHAYMLQKDFISAVKAIDRLLIVEPERWVDRRDRGLLFVELECAGAAVKDLEAYLDNVPDADDANLLRRIIPTLKRQTTMMS